MNIQKGTTYRFPESACLACLVDNSQIVLVEQFRTPTSRRTLELPGGVIKDGETPLQAATREFCEETGLIPGPSRFLFTLDLDLSTTIHRTHVFATTLAQGAIKSDAELRTRFLRIDDSLEMVRTGEITHAPTVAAILAICSKYYTETTTGDL